MHKNLSITWKVLKLFWHATGVYVVIQFFSDTYSNTFYPFIQALLLAKTIDLLTTAGQTSDLQRFIWVGLAYIFSSLLNYYLGTYEGMRNAFFQGKIELYLNILVVKKLSTLDPATFEKSKFQSLLAQTDGTIGPMVVLLERVSGLINFIIKVIIALMVIAPVFPWIAPIVIIATLPVYFISDSYRQKLWPYYSEKRSRVIRLISYVRSLLSSDSTSKEAIIFKTGKILHNKVQLSINNYLKPFDKVSEDGVEANFAGNILQVVAFVYSLYLLLNAVVKQIISIGQFTLYFQQIIALAAGVENILNMYSSISMRTDYIEKFFQLMETKKVISSPENPTSFPASDLPCEITFKNISFKYPKTERYILKNFNLTIKPGEKIALVGENGAGKTTLIKLLLRFYDVTEGELLINKINIKQLNLDDWYKQIGVLFQDFIKYQFTFKENIIFGNQEKKTNIDLLYQAIKKAGADKFLSSLPKGLEQTVGKMFDDGIELSGGQWQKSALARAFFRDAPILILDEPTSAIDAKSEYEIYENVQKLQKDKTVIIISHRFSTVRNADRIIVLEDGKIVEEGDHKKLMREKGLYAELFELQAKGYK